MLSVIQHLQTPKHLFMSCCLLNTSSSVMFPCVKRVFVPGQMLNCCIERKKARDESHKVPEGKGKEHRVSGACQKSRQGPECATSASSSTREMSQGKSWDSWSDSEEEFFECLSDQGETEATQAEGRAEGRLHPYNNMTLLNSAEPLYVPVTQVRVTASLCKHIICCYLFQIQHVENNSRVTRGGAYPIP